MSSEGIKFFTGRIGISKAEREVAVKYAKRFNLHSSYLRLRRYNNKFESHLFLFGFDENDILYRISSECFMNMKPPIGKQVDKEYKLAYFILRARKVHGDKYDYRLLRNEDMKGDKMLPIICPEHQLFFQRKRNHIIDRQGCWRCGEQKVKFKRKYGGQDNRVRTQEEDYIGNLGTYGNEDDGIFDEYIENIEDSSEDAV